MHSFWHQLIHLHKWLCEPNVQVSCAGANTLRITTLCDSVLGWQQRSNFHAHASSDCCPISAPVNMHRFGPYIHSEPWTARPHNIAWLYPAIAHPMTIWSCVWVSQYLVERADLATVSWEHIQVHAGHRSCGGQSLLVCVGMVLLECGRHAATLIDLLSLWATTEHLWVSMYA